ncbi:hypothetical protein G6F56_010240 [Rhizopus delemar]|nr:hypothetical protein G6F56_010240 [Rhizopus delemar]
MDEGVVIKELLFALNHTPVEKKPTFVPQQIITSPKVQPLIQKNQTLPLNSKRESTLEKKRETKKEPQKLSNRLLDMFQPKKPKSQIDLNNIQPTQELNHPTKYRPRKPPSLKKTLTFPAATAQPDWRVRSTTKKFEFAA